MGGDGEQLWEQRWHPLRREWVLYTEHRAGRPWIGETHAAPSPHIPSWDPDCALCPRNERLAGTTNPDYTGAWWFANDLPCFAPVDDPPANPASDSPADRGSGIRRRRPAVGRAEVVCFDPAHDLSFADLTDVGATAVVELWAERTAELQNRDEVAHVLVFENRGELVGTSNPHPHNQIYAGNLVYAYAEREDESARCHRDDTGRLLGADIVAAEASGPRVVESNDSFVACVPWFARYAYEVLVLPREPVAHLAALGPAQLADLATIMRGVVRRYDALWSQPMPYVLAVHQAPCDGRATEHYPFHLEYHPPLRRPDTMKYLAGPEIGGGSMTNESDPDVKAAELRAVDADRPDV